MKGLVDTFLTFLLYWSYQQKAVQVVYYAPQTSRHHHQRFLSVHSKSSLFLFTILQPLLGAGSVVDKSYDAFFFVRSSCSALQASCLFAFGLVPGKFFDAFFWGSCSTGYLFDVRLRLDFCTTFDAIIANNLSCTKLNRMN